METAEIISEDKIDFNQINQKYDDLKEEGRIEFITFHPSYSYEEFVEGITVDTEGNNGDLNYIKKDGIFKKICSKALKNALKSSNNNWKELIEDYKNKLKDLGRDEMISLFSSADRFVLIIDEINRGEMSKIFGELITLIEPDKRISESNELMVQLPYSNEIFGVPPNLYIVGTMNTADRSIALLDVALRRRFGFKEMMPELEENSDLYKIKTNELKQEDFKEFNLLRKAIISMNKRISEIPEIGRDKQIGHSFLFRINTKEDIKLIWNYEIIPLIEEYCYGDPEKMREIFSIEEVRLMKSKTEHKHILSFFG